MNADHETGELVEFLLAELRCGSFDEQCLAQILDCQMSMARLVVAETEAVLALWLDELWSYATCTADTMAGPLFDIAEAWTRGVLKKPLRLVMVCRPGRSPKLTITAT